MAVEGRSASKEKNNKKKILLLLLLLLVIAIAIFKVTTHLSEKRGIKDKDLNYERLKIEREKEEAQKAKKEQENKEEPKIDEVIEEKQEPVVENVSNTNAEVEKQNSPEKKAEEKKIAKATKPADTKKNGQGKTSSTKKDNKSTDSKKENDKKEVKPEKSEEDKKENTEKPKDENSKDEEENKDKENNNSETPKENETPEKTKPTVFLRPKEITKGEKLTLENVKEVIGFEGNVAFNVLDVEENIKNFDSQQVAERTVKVKIDFVDEKYEDTEIEVTIRVTDRISYTVKYMQGDVLILTEEITGKIGQKLNIPKEIVKSKKTYIVENFEARPEILPEKGKTYIITVIEKKKEFAKGKAELTEYEKDGKKIYTLWVKGIKPPRYEDFNIKVDGTFKTPILPFKNGQSWYDANKLKEAHESHLDDEILCSGAVSANLLHWWLEQNQENVARYLEMNPDNAKLEGEENPWRNLNTYIDSFKGQNDSEIFNMYKLYFGNTGKTLWSDTAIDMFINGYRPSDQGATNTPTRYTKDSRGGFFHEVFGKEILTQRMHTGNTVQVFGNTVREELKKGHAMGITHKTFSSVYEHIVTLWGADFDEDGNIIGIYIADSDDQHEGYAGMKRYDVKVKNGKPVITTNTTPNTGSEVEYLHVLKLGTEKWDAYFKAKEATTENTMPEILPTSMIETARNVMSRVTEFLGI